MHRSRLQRPSTAKHPAATDWGSGAKNRSTKNRKETKSPQVRWNSGLWAFAIFVQVLFRFSDRPGLQHRTQEPRLLKTKQNVKTMTSAEIDALEFYNSIDEPSGKHVQRFEEVVKYFTHGELFNIDRSWSILAEIHLELKNSNYLRDFVTVSRQLGLRIDDIEANQAYVGSGLSVYTITFTIFSAELKKYKTHREIIQALSSLDYIYHIEELR